MAEQVKASLACGRVCGSTTFRWAMDLAAREAAQVGSPNQLMADWATADDHLDCPDCFPEPWLSREGSGVALRIQGYEPLQDHLGYGMRRMDGQRVDLATLDKPGGRDDTR